MSSEITTILLDLGRVVFNLNFELTWQTWSAESGIDLAELKKRFDNEIGKSHNDEHYQNYERGIISSEAYLESFNRRVGASLSHDQFLRGWNAMFTDPVSGMKNLLHDVKQADIPLFAFSNTNVDHEKIWTRRYADSLKHFDEIYTSSGIGHRKPAVQSFQVVVEKIGAPAESILFFDDLEENVVGARDAGMAAEVFVDTATARDAIKRAIGRSLD